MGGQGALLSTSGRTELFLGEGSMCAGITCVQLPVWAGSHVVAYFLAGMKKPPMKEAIIFGGG
jgi:hypothetical protein